MKSLVCGSLGLALCVLGGHQDLSAQVAQTYPNPLTSHWQAPSDVIDESLLGLSCHSVHIEEEIRRRANRDLALVQADAGASETRADVRREVNTLWIILHCPHLRLSTDQWKELLDNRQYIILLLRAPWVLGYGQRPNLISEIAEASLILGRSEILQLLVDTHRVSLDSAAVRIARHQTALVDEDAQLLFDILQQDRIPQPARNIERLMGDSRLLQILISANRMHPNHQRAAQVLQELLIATVVCGHPTALRVMGKQRFLQAELVANGGLRLRPPVILDGPEPLQAPSLGSLHSRLEKRLRELYDLQSLHTGVAQKDLTHGLVVDPFWLSLYLGHDECADLLARFHPPVLPLDVASLENFLYRLLQLEGRFAAYALRYYLSPDLPRLGSPRSAESSTGYSLPLLKRARSTESILRQHQLRPYSIRAPMSLPQLPPESSRHRL